MGCFLYFCLHDGVFWEDLSHPLLIPFFNWSGSRIRNDIGVARDMFEFEAVGAEDLVPTGEPIRTYV
jgi:hypothetical protein